MSKNPHILVKAESYFSALDKNHDGFIDRNEIKSALENVGIPVTPVLIQMILKECDFNQDGKISIQEFKKFSVKQDQKLKALFDKFDSDHNGTLDLKNIKDALEFINCNVDNDIAQNLLEKMDLNKSGTISYEEFLTFYYLIPVESLRGAFDFWAKSAAIDIGESVTINQEQKKGTTSALVTLVSGGVAGAFSRTATAPLDRLKVILQAQTKGKTSILEGLKGIYNEGGIKGFFRGNGTNVVKIIPETAIKFLMYDKIKSLICKHPKSPTTKERLLSGAVAGFTSQTMIYPLEITKTRLALAKPGIYNGIIDTMSQIIKKEGVSALYKGWAASVLGIIPYASIDLAVFNTLRDLYTTTYSQDPSVLTLLSCGGVSGICGQLVSYPLARVRTCLQSQGLPGREKEFSGMSDCFLKTVKQDGFKGLYRGIIPNFMKSIPAISISYAVFESIKRKLS